MTGALTLRLPDPLKAEAQAYAEGLGVSLNALCAVALRDYLDDRKGKPAQPPARVASRAPVSSPAPTVPVRKAAPSPAARRPTGPPVPKVGRNEPCPCGSGKKYKQCHGMPGRA